MRIGLVGKPNVGKSTFFNAATAAHAAMGDYPFTTIEANRGVGYVRVPDPGSELGVESTPRSGRVIGATRYVPVDLVDVAGLVPGAHEGRGLGNRFLTDLSRADVLLHIVDASGATDAEGTAGRTGSHDPAKDVAFLVAEIDAWIEGLLRDGWDRFARHVQQEEQKVAPALVERLSGIGVTEPIAAKALRGAGLAAIPLALWPEDGAAALARAVRAACKPIVTVLNKADIASDEQVAALRAAIEEPVCIASAQAELALVRGSASGLVHHVPGSDAVEFGDGLNEAQREGLEYIRSHVLARFGSTGVHAALEAAVFGTLDYLAVYPVEDDHKFTDKDGYVLPDCHLVPRGTTAKQLAYRVHTDLGEHFVRGIDCRTHRAIGADHELGAGDVIRIAAA